MSTAGGAWKAFAYSKKVPYTPLPWSDAPWLPVSYIVASRAAVVVALDWTDFDRAGHSTLVASMVTLFGRATPLIWKLDAAGVARQGDPELGALTDLAPHADAPSMGLNDLLRDVQAEPQATDLPGRDGPLELIEDPFVV